jgi:hypothetical protein
MPPNSQDRDLFFELMQKFVELGQRLPTGDLEALADDELVNAKAILREMSTTKAAMDKILGRKDTKPILDDEDDASQLRLS